MNSAMTNGTIIGTVTKRATASADKVMLENAKGNNGKEAFRLWEKYWIATGRLWANELRAEGLNKTADTLEKHLAWFERNIK